MTSAEWEEWGYGTCACCHGIMLFTNMTHGVCHWCKEGE